MTVDPSGEQARDWLAAELAKDEYHDGRSLLERVLQWIGDQLDRGPGGSVDGASLPPWVIVVVAFLVLATLVALLARVRVERHTVEPADAVLGDSELTVTQFRELGSAAIREQRWNDAVVHFTRAMARDAADRTLLRDAPSLTAHEIGTQLRRVFPAHAQAIDRSTDLFDAVRYGRYAASRADAEHLRDTAQALRQTRPTPNASSSAESPTQTLTQAHTEDQPRSEPTGTRP